MGKHTPGPWEVGGPYPSTSVIACVDVGCGWPDPQPPCYEPICILDQRIEGEQNQQAQANARLIAAAPDLYSALQMWLCYATNVNAVDPKELAQSTMAALEKAGMDKSDLDDAAVAMLRGAARAF